MRGGRRAERGGGGGGGGGVVPGLPDCLTLKCNVVSPAGDNEGLGQGWGGGGYRWGGRGLAADADWLTFGKFLTSQQHASVSQVRICLTSHNMLVYLRDGSAQTIVRTATLK